MTQALPLPTRGDDSEDDRPTLPAPPSVEPCKNCILVAIATLAQGSDCVPSEEIEAIFSEYDETKVWDLAKAVSQELGEE